MIDVHSHIVWGVDDGPAEKSQSLSMLQLAASAGTTDIVATPHSSPDFRFDGNLVRSRIEELRSEMQGRIRIHSGCDFHLSLDNLQLLAADPSPFTINGLAFLLVEFADVLIPPSTESIFRSMQTQGVIPVVTHPERNPILQHSVDRLRKWASSGVLMQVTAQSLTDRFGKLAQNAAWELLRNGLVHVIASDAHDTEHRPPRLDEASEILTREMGAGAAELLLEINPGAIIEGAPVPLHAATPGRFPKRSWFPFWRR